MYDVNLITCYIIGYCNGNGYFISNLKLQEILYFLQFKFLYKKNVLCFEENIIATDTGVIISKINSKYLSYNFSMIPSYGTFKRNFYNIDEEDKEIIDEVISEFGIHSSMFLQKKILQHKAWKEANQSGKYILFSSDNIEQFLELERKNEKPTFLKKESKKAKIYNFKHYKKSRDIRQ